MARNNEAIRELVEEFTERLSALVQQEAIESVQAALGSIDGAARPATRRKKAGVRRKKAAGRRRSGAGSSISSDQLLAAIRRNEGERTEVIARELGVVSKEFKPELDELIASGVVTRKGKARGSTLHLGKSGASPKRAKATRKKAARKTSRKKAGRRKKTSRRKTRAS